MMDIESYIAHPCQMLSIPYWKHKNVVIPDGVRIVHCKDFDEEYLAEYQDEEYFRLSHSLQMVNSTVPEWLEIKTVESEDMETVVSIINCSYGDLSVDRTQMDAYTKTRVYDKDLWLLAYDKQYGVPIGCGIADYDNEAGEGILEWIQVIPAYRNREVGTVIVNQLLYRLSEKANFATVSGKIKSVSQPERLYRKCGFGGDDVWHILRKKC